MKGENMFKSEEENLQRELLLLREENKKLTHEINELEAIINDDNQILVAHENTGELSRNERLFAEATIRAYERLVELSRSEQIEIRKIVGAQETLQEYSRNKKIFLNATIKAFTNLLDLSKKELEEAYETVRTIESFNELNRTEILELLEHIKDFKSQHHIK